MLRRLGVALALALAACGGSEAASPPATSAPPTTTSPPSSSTTTSTSTSTSTSTTAPPAWVVGATPLPLRPDGFGVVSPTPAPLVDRQLPTVDVLPPPASGGFESSVEPIPPEVRARMGGTWYEGCPVPIEGLRYVTVSFVGFDGAVHTGELVVNATVADDVVGVFRTLFDARFPIEGMRLTTDADVAAPPTGDGNNTGGFLCRPVRQGTRFSAHASGLAIDVNPFHNPYQRGDLVLPELASSYLDRSVVRPGMIVEGDVVVQAFEAIGWEWGGRWRSLVDHMHFTATGG